MLTSLSTSALALGGAVVARAHDGRDAAATATAFAVTVRRPLAASRFPPLPPSTTKPPPFSSTPHGRTRARP